MLHLQFYKFLKIPYFIIYPSCRHLVFIYIYRHMYIHLQIQALSVYLFLSLSHSLSLSLSCCLCILFCPAYRLLTRHSPLVSTYLFFPVISSSPLTQPWLSSQSHTRPQSHFHLLHSPTSTPSLVLQTLTLFLERHLWAFDQKRRKLLMRSRGFSRYY